MIVNYYKYGSNTDIMNIRILLGNGRFPVHRQVPVPGRTSQLVPRRLAGAHALPLEPATQIELPPFRHGVARRKRPSRPVAFSAGRIADRSQNLYGRPGTV